MLYWPESLHTQGLAQLKCEHLPYELMTLLNVASNGSIVPRSIVITKDKRDIGQHLKKKVFNLVPCITFNPSINFPRRGYRLSKVNLLDAKISVNKP